MALPVDLEPVGKNGNGTTADPLNLPTDAEAQNNPFARWWFGTDPEGERREIAAFNRELASAREARDFEEYMSNTAFQRKVADVTAAGFSPLAALDGAGQGAAVPSAQMARDTANVRKDNSITSVLGALIAAIGLIASKGVAAGTTTAKGAADLGKLRVYLRR